MGAIDFSEYFWGEKNEGFSVLYQNMKCGVNAAKDLAELFREMARIQDESTKSHLKMVKQLSSNAQAGTFSPLLGAFKTKIEKLAAIHNQWMLKLSDLVKEILKYSDELQKTHKKVKEDEAGTLEAVKIIQETTLLLQKSKEVYKQKCLEIERLKRDNATQKDLEKSEAKFRKAQEEYKSLVEKYGIVREEFEKRMSVSSKKFQDIETTHLKQMREFIESYCQIVDNNNNQWGRVQQDFQIQLSELTVENLLEQFALAKYTGLEKPGRWERFKFESSLKHSPLKSDREKYKEIRELPESSHPLRASHSSGSTEKKLTRAKSGPVEFEDEKVSVASLTGPASDVSDKSGNSDKLSLGSAGAPSGSGSAGITRKESSDVNEEESFIASKVDVVERSPSVPPQMMSLHTTNDQPCMSNKQKDFNNGHGWPTTSGSEQVSVSAVSGSLPSTTIQTTSTSTTVDTESTAPSQKAAHLTSIPSVTTSSPVANSAIPQSHHHILPIDSADCSSATEEQHSPIRSSPLASWTGFLRRRQKKDKKRKDDLEESQKDMGSEGEDMRKSQTPTPDVDEEGFSKQPPASDPWADFNQPSKSFYSSSDESDDESKKKIKVEIKPLSNGANPANSVSVDELRSAIGGLDLGAVPLSKVRRPQSALNERIGFQTMRAKTRDNSAKDIDNSGLRRSQSQNYVNKPSQDLLGLSLHPIDPIDPVSTIDENSIGNKTATPAKDVSSAMNDSSLSVIKTPGGASSASGALDTSAMSASSKEIRDIFGDLSEQQPTLPPKQQAQSNRPASVHREKISNSLIALPRPPSRHGTSVLPGTTGRPRGSASAANSSPVNVLGDHKLSIARQDSGSNRASGNASDSPATRPIFGISRGPSPLTLGMSEVVPLAVAFQEVCHVCFRGTDESKCQVRLIGDMMVSFPAGIVNILSNNPNAAPLLFRIKNASVLDAVVPNRELIVPIPTKSTNECLVYEFQMSPLKELLKKQYTKNPAAAYFNVDILKYQIQAKPGAGSCPLQMVAYWKCTEEHTDLRLDYKYNAHAMGAGPSPLLNVSIAVPVDGGVKNMQSKPTGTWLPENNRALWKIPELSNHIENGIGSLRARFELESGPGSQGTIATQFNCEGTTLSNIEFELVGSGYRLSLVKKRFVSGKYICDGDATPDNRYRYAVPPST